jgi:hypothetical protein
MCNLFSSSSQTFFSAFSLSFHVIFSALLPFLQQNKICVFLADSTLLELERKLLDATSKFNANNSAKCNNASDDSCILGSGRAVMCKYLDDDDMPRNNNNNININNNYNNISYTGNHVEQCNVMHLQSSNGMSIASQHKLHHQQPQQQQQQHQHLQDQQCTENHCSRVKYLNNCRSNLCKTTADPTMSTDGNSTIVVNAMSRSNNLLKNFL